MTHTFGLDGGGTLAADATGQVYVAWHGKAPGAAAGEAGRQIWITRSTDDGKTFTSEQPAWNEPIPPFSSLSLPTFCRCHSLDT